MMWRMVGNSRSKTKGTKSFSTKNNQEPIRDQAGRSQQLGWSVIALKY